MFHFNLNTILRNNHTSDSLNYIALFGNSVFCVAVNCFILISGYFGINIKLKSLVKLFIQTEFYSFIALGIGIAFIGFQKGLLKSLMPFNPTGLWFIPLYILLYVSSPLLNQIVQNKRLHLTVLAFTIAFSFGAYFGGGYQGYGFPQFVMLYLIGRYISLYTAMPPTSKCIFYTFTGVVCTFILSILWTRLGHPVGDKMIIAYSSPWVLWTSISVFELFRSLTKVHNRFIPLLATSSLSVYLFHENALINKYIYIYILDFLEVFFASDFIYVLVIVLYAICIYVVVLFIDQIRLHLQKKLIHCLEYFKLL